MKVVQVLAFLSWFAGTSYLLTHLHALHFVDHSPQHTNRLVSPVASWIDPGEWNMVHYFDLKCGCSQAAIDHLLRRGPQSHRDIFVLINSSEEVLNKIKNAGFNHIVPWSGSTDDLLIDGVPLLTIYAPEKKLVYSGGYRQGSITPLHSLDDMKLLSIFQQNNEASTRYPASGCHISKKYQKMIDPLGVKYGNEG